MKFLINKYELIQGISTVEKFVPVKSTVSILSGIRFLAEDNVLQLSATDLDLGIEYKIESTQENLEIIETGDIVIGSKILSDIVRRIPNGMVEFVYREDRIHISSGEFNMVLSCFNADDFPEISKKELLKTISLEQKLFKHIIKQTIFARAEDDSSRPQLTGILLEYKDGILNIVALDGFRIAWRYERVNPVKSIDADYFKIIVPGDTLLEIFRIFSDDDEAVFELYSGHNRVEFVTDKILISSRILDGKFIDYEKVMQVEPKTTVIISTEELHQAIERANVLAREAKRSNLIKLTLADNIIEIQAETEIGSISDKVPCEMEGEELVIAFNAMFLIDALRVITAPKVELNFSSDAGPCIITPLEIDNYKNFILPVKLRGESS